MKIWGCLSLILVSSNVYSECRVLTPEEQKLTGRKVICDEKMLNRLEFLEDPNKKVRIHPAQDTSLIQETKAESQPPSQETFEVLLGILKSIFYGFSNKNTIVARHIKNGEFSYTGCPPLDQIGMSAFVFIGKDYPHRLIFSEACDMQGHVVLSKNKFSKSDVELRHIPKYTKVTFEMKVTFEKLTDELKIKFDFKNGRALSLDSPQINFHGTYQLYASASLKKLNILLYEKSSSPGHVYMTLDSGEKVDFKFVLFSHDSITTFFK